LRNSNLFCGRKSPFAVPGAQKPQDFSPAFKFSQAWRGNPVVSRQALWDERPKLTADGIGNGRHGSQPRITSAGFDGVQADPWKATHGRHIVQSKGGFNASPTKILSKSDTVPGCQGCGCASVGRPFWADRRVTTIE
jgi:hypothetical protein